VGDVHSLYYFSNIEKNCREVERGVHGVSNHLLDTPWPKVEKGKAGLSAALHENDLVEKLFMLLQNADPAPDELLPRTGVSFEWEKRLSQLFIKSEHYGTRSSTVMLVSEKEIQYVERVFSNEGMKEQ